MIFKAELKQTKQRKAASMDNIYQVVFETDNPMIMDLGKLPANTLFSVSIDIMVEAKEHKEIERLEL